jgi:hypothetical protein
LIRRGGIAVSVLEGGGEKRARSLNDRARTRLSPRERRSEAA